MLRDFIHAAHHLQQSRLAEWSAQAKADALRREARMTRRLRSAVAHRLIALGERMLDRPARASDRLDTAA